MRRALITARILTAFCAVCLTVLLNWQNHNDAAVTESYQHRQSSVLASQHQHQQEATLTDASQIYRICSSRPQRVLPTQGSKTERTVTPFGGFANRQHQYSPSEGERVARLLDMPLDKMDADIQQKGKRARLFHHLSLFVCVAYLLQHLRRPIFGSGQ